MSLNENDNHKEIFVTRTSMPSYEEYIEAIKPLWDSHWLTNMGVYHKELEKRLTEYLDVPYLSLMVNGHMSLELAIQSFNFPEGSEVITTPFTFISTTHAIVRNRLKPVFCDVNESDGTIDETKIEDLITEKTVAILAVHVYGHICNVKKIQEIADKYNLVVIYDAAHAFGEKYCGTAIGNFGDVSTFSFHATKVFNTIEGGAVVVHTKKQYDKLYNLKNFGIRGEELVVDVGANAKMNEFAAIMGLCNLTHIEENLQKRDAISKMYDSLLTDAKGVRLFKGTKEASANNSYYPILVDEKEYGNSRDELYDRLKENGIHARKYFYPLTSDQACFKNKYKNDRLDIARKLSKSVLCIPMYADLGADDVEIICKIIKGYSK